MKKSLQMILAAAVALWSISAFFASFARLRVAAAGSEPFFTQNGEKTTLLTCGTSSTFDVTGFSQVWLTQLKSSTSLGNNQKTFDGPYTVPSNYTPNCTSDVGTFQNSVYTIVNGQRGDFLGSVEATIKLNSGSAEGAVTISDPALRTCFDHLAAVGGVLHSTDNLLSPGESLIRTMNTQPAFANNQITSANVSRSTLDQIVTALNSTPLFAPNRYYFDSTACVGFLADGTNAYGPGGYTSNVGGQPRNANGCPAWWTGSDRCSFETVGGNFNPDTSSVNAVKNNLFNIFSGKKVPGVLSGGTNAAGGDGNTAVPPSSGAADADVQSKLNDALLNLLSIQSQLSGLALRPTGADPEKLLSEIQNIQKQLGIQTPAPGNSISSSGGNGSANNAAPSSCHDFNADLKIGDTGNEVAALRDALAKEGFPAAVSENADVFDESLASSVSAFQEKYAGDILDSLNLKSGTGYVGRLTRAKLNALYGCSSSGGANGGPGNGAGNNLVCSAGQDVFAPEQYVPVFNPATDKPTDSKFGVVYPPATPYTHPPLADFSQAFLDDFTNRVYGVPFAKLKRITDPAIKAKFDAAAHVFAHTSLHVPEDQLAGQYDEFNKEIALGFGGDLIASSLNRRALVFQKAGLSVGEVLLNYIDLETRSPGRSTYGLDAEPNEATLQAYFHLFNELYKKNIPQYQFFFDWNRSIGFSNSGAAWGPQGYVFDWRRNGWTADGYPKWWPCGPGVNSNNFNRNVSSGSGSGQSSSPSSPPSQPLSLSNLQKVLQQISDKYVQLLNQSVALGQRGGGQGAGGGTGAPGGNNNGNGGNSSSNIFTCPNTSSHFTAGFGGSAEIMCVGDTISAHIPTGFKYLDTTYTGPELNYEFTVTNLEQGSGRIDRKYGFTCMPNDLSRTNSDHCVLSGVAATFNLAINGRSQGSVTDYFAPSDEYSDVPGPDVAYFVEVTGSKADRHELGTDANGRKYGDIVVWLARRKTCQAGDDGVVCSGPRTSPGSSIGSAGLPVNYFGYGVGFGPFDNSGNSGGGNSGSQNAPATLSFSPSKESYCVGDSVTWSVNSNPSGLNADLYRTHNGVQDIAGDKKFSVKTSYTSDPYAFNANDVGNWSLFYRVDTGNGSSVNTNTFTASVNSCSRR